MKPGGLSIWTIYRAPRDLPGVAFAARRFVTGPGTYTADAEVITGDTLDEVRAKLPPFLCLMPRSPGDDPVIVESWI
jgi:hypothetical protein